jgi:hypothetical protein
MGQPPSEGALEDEEMLWRLWKLFLTIFISIIAIFGRCTTLRVLLLGLTRNGFQIKWYREQELKVCRFPGAGCARRLT